jgi:hypothetical protein
MRSLNFHYPNLPTAVDELGADAEYLAVTYPDLALVRIRQMVEVLATHLEGKTRHVDTRDDGLSVRLWASHKAKPFPKDFSPEMFKRHRPRGAKRHVPIQVLNEVSHHATTRKRDGASYSNTAVACLRDMSALWAAVAGVEPTVFELPLEGEEWRHQAWKQHIKLNHAERLADNQRSYPAAQAELDAVTTSAMKRLGAPQEELDLIWLRGESIRLAMANHQGVAPVLDESNEAIDRLLVWSDQRGRDQIHRLANRQAVGLTNTLRLDEARECISKHIEWREWTHAGAIERIGEQPIYDHERGALLGTAGQISGLQAHAERDLGLLVDAVECFEAATQYFTLDSDRYRQQTYTLQALVERVRLGGELDGQERDRVLDAIRAVDPNSLSDAELFNEKFRLFWALKASHVMGEPLSSAARTSVLDWAAKVDGTRPIGHPDVSIAGWAMVLYPNGPKCLGKALEQTVAEDKSLIGWIANVFLAEVRGDGYPAPPAALQAWWDRYDLGQRERSCAVAVLPFYFA